jgi:hypothetical protein
MSWTMSASTSMSSSAPSTERPIIGEFARTTAAVRYSVISNSSVSFSLSGDPCREEPRPDREQGGSTDDEH